MKDERNSRKECELLVQNIAQSHARLAPGIQLAMENQWEVVFSECLQKYSRDKQEEIRDVCSSHYQEFVQSIEEIVQIKCDASQLQIHIDKYQNELVQATQEILQGSDLLIACQTTQKHIDTSIERLQQCQRIVQMATKVDDYIRQTKFYHALKLMESIRNDIANFPENSFSKRVHEWITATMQHLRDQTTKKTSAWLEEIRNAAIPIGAQAMKSCEENMTFNIKSNEATVNDGGNLPSLDNLVEQASSMRTQKAIYGEYVQKTLALLAPMLRIVHVYQCLHKTPELASFYHSNRMPQLQFSAFLAGDIGSISADKFALQHEDIFKRFVGTFCLEKMLAIYSNEILLTKAEVHAACFSVLQSLCGLIMALVIKIPSPKVVLQIKRNAVLCARVLGNDVHQFNTALIYDAFRGMGEFFRKKVAADIKGKWREYLKQDNFQQVIVNKNTCLKNLELCGLQKRCDEFLKTADSRGNISLPFTSIVQHGCHEIHEMIDAMFHFEWHLNIPEWGNLVRDDTWEALSELSTVLNELIERTDDLQISQAVITAANSSYLSSACDVIAAVLTQQIESWESRTRLSNQTPKQQVKNPRATAASTKKKFESTSTRAQDMVCELMVKKIDDLISSFFFLNWTATEVNSQVDPCMSDLINYLQASFTQLGTLPLPIREAVHFASCIHINKALEQVLVGPTIKRITMSSLLNFKRNLGTLLDDKELRILVDALMQFANACNVTQLRECFLPLTQMVDLIVSNDIEHLDTSMFNRNGGKYTHVMPDQVIAVLEKYKEVAATGASKFFKSKKTPAEGGLKKAVIDSVVKQLRMMNPHAK